MTCVQESKKLDYAPWQRVSANGKPFVICQVFDVECYSDPYFYVLNEEEYDYNNNNVFHVSSPHLHGKKKYDLNKPDSLCIGCDTCNEWNPCNSGIKGVDPDTHELIIGEVDQCIHAKALIAYLTQKRDYKGQVIEEYLGGWTHSFQITKRPLCNDCEVKLK